jgi:small subunit ribosomal protein S6e
MANAKIVFADVKAGRCFQKELDNSLFLDKQIGDKIKVDTLGLEGYEVEITGGSEKSGVPMRRDLPGSVKRKLLITKATGAKIKRKGARIRKTVVGHTIDEKTAQINVKVLTYGSKPINECLEVEIKPTKKETREAEKKKKVEEAKAAAEAAKAAEAPKVEEKPAETPKEETKPVPDTSSA